MTDQPILNITGEKEALGPYHRDLLPHFVKWVNDFEATMFTQFTQKASADCGYRSLDEQFAFYALE